MRRWASPSRGRTSSTRETCDPSPPANTATPSSRQAWSQCRVMLRPYYRDCLPYQHNPPTDGQREKVGKGRRFFRGITVHGEKRVRLYSGAQRPECSDLPLRGPGKGIERVTIPVSTRAPFSAPGSPVSPRR